MITIVKSINELKVIKQFCIKRISSKVQKILHNLLSLLKFPKFYSAPPPLFRLPETQIYNEYLTKHFFLFECRQLVLGHVNRRIDIIFQLIFSIHNLLLLHTFSRRRITRYF